MAINSIDFVAVSVLIWFNTRGHCVHCGPLSRFSIRSWTTFRTDHIAFYIPRDLEMGTPMEKVAVVFNKPSRATTIGRPNPLTNAFDFDTCASMKPKQPNNNNTNWSNLC